MDYKKHIPLGCSALTAFVFFMLWLSESQFGQGTLRTRNLNETCGWSIVGTYECSEGLKCNASTCILPELSCPECPVPVYNCSDLKCAPCPTRPVKPNTQNVYDYLEWPGHWVDVGPHGYYNTLRDIDYPGCKAVCSSSSKCKIANYQNDARFCWLAKQYYIPFIRNVSWTSAIKILHE